MTKKPRKRMIMIILLAALAGFSACIGIYYYVLFATWDHDPNFLQADACLDYGGVWEREIARCWTAGECEDEGGFWYPAESRCASDSEFGS